MNKDVVQVLYSNNTFLSSFRILKLLKTQWNFRRCFLFPICHPLNQGTCFFFNRQFCLSLWIIIEHIQYHSLVLMGNRKQSPRFYWFYKEFKNSKTTSEGPYGHILLFMHRFNIMT